MSTVRKLLEKINIDKETIVRWEEPMSAHTTFRIGGPAAAWVRPSGAAAEETTARLFAAAHEEGLALFVLGGGANVVFPDKGYPGIVLDMGAFSAWRLMEGEDAPLLEAGAGAVISDLAFACAALGLDALSFFAGMPGELGGSVWMNARCYGGEIADVLEWTDIIDEDGEPRRIGRKEGDFSYKRSPFQKRRVVITRAAFRCKKADTSDLTRKMEQIRSDRTAKGHYRLPSAGSAFKNDYSYGVPTGRIVDELGLRGTQIGGARVSDWHGNLIVNTGGATAADVRALVSFVSERVASAIGLQLEPEIIFIDP